MPISQQDIKGDGSASPASLAEKAITAGVDALLTHISTSTTTSIITVANETNYSLKFVGSAFKQGTMAFMDSIPQELPAMSTTEMAFQPSGEGFDGAFVLMLWQWNATSAFQLHDTYLAMGTYIYNTTPANSKYYFSASTSKPDFETLWRDMDSLANGGVTPSKSVGYEDATKRKYAVEIVASAVKQQGASSVDIIRELDITLSPGGPV